MILITHGLCSNIILRTTLDIKHIQNENKEKKKKDYPEMTKSLKAAAWINHHYNAMPRLC
jgi:hypothetical protein